MAKKAMNNVKLGAFVLVGLVLLIVMLYMIGKNRNLFGSNFILKARFGNVHGLKPGNNVRYAGIDVGTIKIINVLNDTTMEVAMIINENMKSIIQRNALASIGTDGLVGNKVVNIVPVSGASEIVKDGDILTSKENVATDEMLETLDKTNIDINIIAQEMKTTMKRINSSSALWGLLSDEKLPNDLKSAVANIRLATLKADNMVSDLNSIVRDVKNGKGSAGVILTDTMLVYNLNEAILKIKKVGDSADNLLHQASSTVAGVQRDINNGKGPVNALLKDAELTAQLNKSLDNIQKGTDAFNQSMDALKHSFLFRGYFRKQEKKSQDENISK